MGKVISVLKNTALIVFVLLMLFLAFFPSPSFFEPPLDEGSIQSGLYVNRYFRLSFTIPQGWTVRDNRVVVETLKATMEREPHNLHLSDQYYKKYVRPLITLTYEHPEAKNPLPGLISWVAFNESYKNVSTPPLQFFLSGVECVLGGKRFLKREESIETESVHNHTEQYCLVEKGYVVIVTASYSNEEQKRGIDTVLKSIAFTD